MDRSVLSNLYRLAFFGFFGGLRGGAGFGERSSHGGFGVIFGSPAR